MTLKTNARLAGSAFLVYIAAGVSSMVLFGRAASGEGAAEKLAGIARHGADAGGVLVLGLVECFAALILAVTLYAITREHDRDLAMLAMTCRVGEGVISGTSILETQKLCWLATADGANAPEAGAVQVLGEHLLRGDVSVTGTFFAVGSAIFCYLLLRGRAIPASLAWLGVIASLLLVVGLPLKLAGLLHGSISLWMWMPMLAFEVPFALWLLIKGVRADASAHRMTASATS